MLAGVFCLPQSVGTACSGTDSPVIALAALTEALLHMGFPSAPTIHEFSCEADPAKRGWIRRVCRPLHLFDDIRNLGQNFARDVVHGDGLGFQSRVPEVFLFIAGFSCKSVSGLNLCRGMYQNACAIEVGETGITFGGVRKYLSAKKPCMFVLENVVGLNKQLPAVESERGGLSIKCTIVNWQRNNLYSL